MSAMMGDPATLQAAIVAYVAEITEHGTRNTEQLARYDPTTCRPPYITESDVRGWMERLDVMLFGNSIFR